MKMRHTFAAAILAFAALGIGSANAATYVVDALANSSTGGAGLATLSLNDGQQFSVSSSLADFWSLGGLPRFTNADGLTADAYATAGDNSGMPAGTHISMDFGLWNQAGYAAPYGSLVGEIGGVYQLLGASFTGAAWGTGTLNLFNWDSVAGDNSGSITVNVSAVPEPATWAMLLIGFGAIGFAMRGSRKQAAAATA